MGVDMTLCSRRAWTTPAALPTCPLPATTTTGSARCVWEKKQSQKQKYIPKESVCSTVIHPPSDRFRVTSALRQRFKGSVARSSEATRTVCQAAGTPDVFARTVVQQHG